MSNTAKVNGKKVTSNSNIKAKTNCSECNRPLRVPESKKLGICRSCRRKAGSKPKAKAVKQKTEKPTVKPTVVIPQIQLENKTIEKKINDYLSSSVGPGQYYDSIESLLKKLETTKHKTWATIPVEVFVTALKGVAK